ncbi:hypothetical protein HKK80_09145 [Halonotius sp. F2-221B]|uniref:hypothetical protein n=1 Tax=Halonotius sp. F2-221B TaxID=2731620 RepID=UPI00398B7488
MVDKNNRSKKGSESKVQRRTCLQTIAATGLFSVGIGTTSAESNPTPEVVEEVTISIPDESATEDVTATQIGAVENNTTGLEHIDPTISGIENIDTISVQKYETGRVSYVVSGSSATAKNHPNGFSIRSGITPNTESDQLAVEVVPIANKNSSDKGRSGNASGSKDTGSNEAASSISSKSNLNSNIKLLTEDSGEDLLQNFEGGIHAQADTNEQLISDRARHIQTYEWEANSSNSEVVDRSGSYSTHWITYDVHQWDLEGNGWKETGYPGDNAYGKSYSQLTKYEDATTKRTQLQADMTMKPDGTFEWWGKVDNEDSTWGASFQMYTDYVDNPSI